MKSIEYTDAVVITADENKYLVLKNIENSESIIGKPIKVAFNKTGIIPEFEEREVIE